MTRPGLLRLLTIVVATSSAACSIDLHSSEITKREEKRFTVSSTEPVEVRLRTFDGGISVKSWDQGEVLVEIERRGPDQASTDAIVVNASQEGNRIVVEAPNPRDQRHTITLGNWVTQSAHFTVTVPRNVTLDAQTGDGAIVADNLHGSVDLNSGDGRIVVARVDGRLKAFTGDGSIRIDGAVGQVDADSGDGSIEIEGQLQELVARTGDGPVRVEAASGSAMKTDWRVTTGDGRIAVRVPDGFNAAVDASTGDGSVQIEGVSDSRATGDESDGRSVVGQLGTGGPTLRLRTGDGSITVSR